METAVTACFVVASVASCALSLSNGKHFHCASILALIAGEALMMKYYLAFGPGSAMPAFIAYLVIGLLGCLLAFRSKYRGGAVQACFILAGMGLFLTASKNDEWATSEAYGVLLALLVGAAMGGMACRLLSGAENGPESRRGAYFTLLGVLLLLSVAALVGSVSEVQTSTGSSFGLGRRYLCVFGALFDPGMAALPLVTCVLAIAATRDARSLSSGYEKEQLFGLVATAVAFAIAIWAKCYSAAVLILLVATVARSLRATTKLGKLAPVIILVLVGAALLATHWPRVATWFTALGNRQSEGWAYCNFFDAIQAGGIFGSGAAQAQSLFDAFYGSFYEFSLAAVAVNFGIGGLVVCAVSISSVGYFALRYRRSDDPRSFAAFLAGFTLLAMGCWAALFSFHILPLPSMYLPFISGGVGTAFVSAALAGLCIAPQVQEQGAAMPCETASSKSKTPEAIVCRNRSRA